MMGRALLVVGWSGVAGLLAAAFLGAARGDTSAAEGLHLQLALGSSLLVLFAHCWILFYLSGTRRAVLAAVADRSWADEPVVSSGRGLQRRSQVWLWPAIGALLALLVVGGAVLAGALESRVHVVLGWVTIGVQVASLLALGGALRRNEEWMVAVDARLAAEETE